MRFHRVSLDELHRAVGGSGADDLASIQVVVLETDGTLSVISTARAGNRSALPVP